MNSPTISADANNIDPAVAVNKKTCGIIAAIMQKAWANPAAAEDNSGEVVVEFVKNWLSLQIKLGASVESAGKLSITCEKLKLIKPNLRGKNKMKLILIFFTLVVVTCAYTYATDIAFYVGAPNVDGWYTAAEVLKNVDTIKNATKGMFQNVSEFGDDKLDDFAKWAEARTKDGKFDIIWLNGCVPSSLYPFPNLKPDGSVIENWLDGGNMVINVGDWFGYVSYEGGGRKAENGPSGAANILNLSSGIIYSADNTKMTTTDVGKKYLPSIGGSCISYRPIALAQVVNPWEVAAVFASLTGDEKATGADPVVIHNTKTGAYVAFINQAAGSGPPGWLDDRGKTCGELITKWVAEVVGLKPVEPAGKLPGTWGKIKAY